MADDKQGDDHLSDVKASFAWGQFFAGSLISGLAVWKLLHKLTSTEPSSWFGGLSAAYEEMREFLFSLLPWNLSDFTTDDKNLLMASIVLLSCSIRVAARYPTFPISIGVGLLFVFGLGMTGGLGDVPYLNSLISSPPSAAVHWQVHTWVAIVFGALSCFLLVPLVFAFDREVRQPAHIFMVLSVSSTLGWGVALLLMNWATS